MSAPTCIRRAGPALTFVVAALALGTTLLAVGSDVGSTGDRAAQVSSLSITRGDAVAPGASRPVEWRSDLGRVEPSAVGAAAAPAWLDLAVGGVAPPAHGRDDARTRAPPAA